MGQKVIFKREHNNPHDKFAVSGKVTMKGKIGLIVVGHVPRELSRYTWYAIQEWARFVAEVYNEKAMASPLVQGGLEMQSRCLSRGLQLKNCQF